EKDRQFYENSGGGITVSGGEPLLQSKFTTALLKECKKRGLHTAIDTCGHAAPVIFKHVVEYADMVLFDIKNIDPEKHCELTGVRNELILENLKVLSGGNKHVQVRVPVILGYNDSEENITGISEFLVKFDFKDAVLIPFHKLGEMKYEGLGRMSATRLMEPPSSQEMCHIKEMFNLRGLQIKIA
ncbi:MAG: glycyl-radical enzyme activating protein, partial [Euryarchaeota archaeon]|nr:glycyl-radical enzyme activating protein [Euryarchaeota archaeon]